MKKLLDSKTEKEITKLYISGLQLDGLAEIYNCSRVTIHRSLRRQNCPLKGHFGHQHNRNNGGITYDNGYRRLCFPGVTTAIGEHRFIIEQHLGRKLHRWELVHHVNGIRDDNRLENLQVMTTSEHNKIHNIKGGLRSIAR